MTTTTTASVWRTSAGRTPCFRPPPPLGRNPPPQDAFQGYARHIPGTYPPGGSTGFVDYLTISSSLLFSGKYARNIGELGKLNFYNNIRLSDYSCEGYLDGLEVVCCDYRELTDKYRDSPDVVFLIDPPYMATDISTYRMDWKLTDYLDVLLVLKGHPFVYFTSGKSPILDFCRWMEEHPETGNPFKGAGMSTLTARMNYSSSYTDIMLYKETTEAA